MTQQEFLGTLVFTIIPLITVIGYFTKIAWHLSGTIKSLELTMININKEHETHSELLHEHELRLDKHDRELVKLASRQ